MPIRMLSYIHGAGVQCVSNTDILVWGSTVTRVQGLNSDAPSVHYRRALTLVMCVVVVVLVVSEVMV